MKQICATFLALGLAIASPHAARAVDSPFEANLLRLAEVLGSLHFLRNLCGEDSDRWLIHMDDLLTSEDPDEERRQRFVASFNRGYSAFQATYTRCNPSAVEAITRYMKEGETLSRETAARYGN